MRAKFPFLHNILDTLSGKLKTVFYEQQNYFEKMMGIKLE